MQPSKMKRDERAGERVSNAITPTIRSSTKHKANDYNIYSEDLTQTHTGPVTAASVPVRHSESCLVDAIYSAFLRFLTLMALTILICPLLRGCWSSNKRYPMEIPNLVSLHLMLDCGCLNLLPTVAGRKLSDEHWTRY